MSEADEYTLGANVTELFRPKENRTTTIVSVRLSAPEWDIVSAIAERERKSVSQVMRDAIAQIASEKSTEPRWVAAAFEGGNSTFFGEGRPLPTGAFGAPNLYAYAESPASASS